MDCNASPRPPAPPPGRATARLCRPPPAREPRLCDLEAELPSSPRFGVPTASLHGCPRRGRARPAALRPARWQPSFTRKDREHFQEFGQLHKEVISLLLFPVRLLSTLTSEPTSTRPGRVGPPASRRSRRYLYLGARQRWS